MTKMTKRLLAADQTRLGFIGMGAMGSRIARRLRDHRYQVTVYDRKRSKADALVPYGASVAGSLAELAANADVILSCLSDDEAVRGVYLAGNGILVSTRPGTVVLEMSTISPAASLELHAAAAKQGVNLMDVAISGSTPAVETGTVTLLAGGDAELFETAEPIFRALATHYFLIGPSGSGVSMKLVVNTLLGIGMQAVAEGIALGEAAGIDRKRLLEVLSQTAVVAPAHVGKLARAEHDDYSPLFGVGLMNKDFHLILQTAKLLNLVLPATAAAFEVNSAALRQDPGADFSFVIRQMESSVARKGSLNAPSETA
jgi:3-hydroxyisobutyrate dehydrogenase/glyoxylate/succinic semialdehyde reductase